MNLISCIVFCFLVTPSNDSCDLSANRFVVKELIKKDKALMKSVPEKWVKEADVGIWITPILTNIEDHCIGLYSYKLSGSHTYYNRFFLYKMDKIIILNRNKPNEVIDNKHIECILKKAKVFLKKNSFSNEEIEKSLEVIRIRLMEEHKNFR